MRLSGGVDLCLREASVIWYEAKFGVLSQRGFCFEVTLILKKFYDVLVA